MAVTVEKIQTDVPLFLLLSASLFFNAIGVSWFYTAVEDFKYITVRSLLVRVCSVIALFIFVKTREDLLYYAAIQVMATVGNNVFNFIRLRKYICWDMSCLSGLQFKKHLQVSLRLFVLNLIVSLYVILDSVMLGFLKDDAAVGYYAGAMRMTKIVLGIVTSLGVVLLPRFSNLLSTGKRGEFINLGNKAISFTLAMVLPMTVGLILLAQPIILLFCGESYEPSILTLQILAPIIIFIGFSGLLGMQVLYPLGYEKLVIRATLLGAILNITLNLLLIPRYSQYGAAVATFADGIAGRKKTFTVPFPEPAEPGICRRHHSDDSRVVALEFLRLQPVAVYRVVSAVGMCGIFRLSHLAERPVLLNGEKDYY